MEYGVEYTWQSKAYMVKEENGLYCIAIQKYGYTTDFIYKK